MTAENRKMTKKDENGQAKGRLSEETINYFKRVDQVLKDNTFEDDEHKDTFLKNVFHQMEKEGIQLTRHTLTSKVLENIIPLLSSEQTEKMVDILKTDIELVCTDRFSSHVVETLCKNMSKHFDIEDTIKVFLKFCKSLRELSSRFLRDIYGSHVLSTVIQVLSGVTVPDTIVQSRTARETKRQFKKKNTSNDKVTVIEVPEKVKKSYLKFTKVILDDDNFGELLCHRSASPVLQVLLLVCNEMSQKKYKSLCDLVVSRARLFSVDASADDEEDENTIHKLPVVLTDEVGSHLIEAVIKTANEEFMQRLSESGFRTFFISLCVHPIANFLSQTFMRSMKTIEQADYFVSKLLRYMEDVLAAGHMGCIVRLAETIARLKMVDKQKKFISCLSTALHISEEKGSKSLSKLIISMMTMDVFYKTEDESESKENDEDESENEANHNTNVMLTNQMINYHGACLLKSCFAFKKSKAVVESFISFTLDEHLTVACHPSGCIVYEGFFQSDEIPKKQKAKLVENLLQSVQVLSADKFGSRVMDCIWKSCDVNLQERIQGILRKYKVQLESDLYGRIILYNCGVKQHISKMNEIKNERIERKRKMFEDILETKNQTEKIEQPVVKKEKKPKNDDRASKYREQLKALGITFDDEVKTEG